MIENTNAEPLYIVLISVHGLIRGSNLELGRDADTGGQTKYVVELAKALAKQPNVGRVDLVTTADNRQRSRSRLRRAHRTAVGKCTNSPYRSGS